MAWVVGWGNDEKWGAEIKKNWLQKKDQRSTFLNQTMCGRVYTGYRRCPVETWEDSWQEDPPHPPKKMSAACVPNLTGTRIHHDKIYTVTTPPPIYDVCTKLFRILITTKWSSSKNTNELTTPNSPQNFFPCPPTHHQPSTDISWEQMQNDTTRLLTTRHTSPQYTNHTHGGAVHHDKQQHNANQEEQQQAHHKLSPPFLPTFLPASIYFLYIILTSLQELPATSIAYVLNNEAGFSPAELMTYYTVCFIPWTLKPLYAILSDNISFCGYRRKPWLIFASLIASVTFLMMLLYGFKDKVIMQICGVTQALCIALSEIQVDALVVALTAALSRRQQQLLDDLQHAVEKHPHAPQYKYHIINSSQRSDEETPSTTTKAPQQGDDKQQLDVDEHLAFLADHFPEYILQLKQIDINLLRTHTALKGSIQSEGMTCRTVASLAAAIASMLLHFVIIPHYVLLVTAIIPLFTIIVLFFISETQFNLIPFHLENDSTLKNETTTATTTTISPAEPTPQQPQPPTSFFIARLSALWYAVKILWKPLLFILLLRSTPQATDPIMSYIFGELKLPAWLLSAYSVISILGGLLATLVYWKFFTRCPLVVTFVLGTFLAALASLPTACLTAQCNTKFLHIPNYAYVIITTLLSAITTRLAMLPSLTLAIESYPEYKTDLRLEATMYSTYTAMNNIGAVISYSSSMYLLHFLHITEDDYSRLPDMVVICAAASLLPLIALPLITCTQRQMAGERSKQQEQQQRSQEGDQLHVVTTWNGNKNKKNNTFIWLLHTYNLVCVNFHHCEAIHQQSWVNVESGGMSQDGVWGWNKLMKFNLIKKVPRSETVVVWGIVCWKKMLVGIYVGMRETW